MFKAICRSGFGFGLGDEEMGHEHTLSHKNDHHVYTVSYRLLLDESTQSTTTHLFRSRK